MKQQLLCKWKGCVWGLCTWKRPTIATPRRSCEGCMKQAKICEEQRGECLVPNESRTETELCYVPQRQVNASVIGMGIGVVGSQWVTHTTLMADSDKLCCQCWSLVRVCERKKLRVNASDSKVLKCQRKTNVQVTTKQADSVST